MKKKLLITFFAVIAVIACAFGFAGCKHTHKYYTEVIAPTCINQGYTFYICRCGDSYEDNYVNPNGIHNFNNYVCIACGEIDPDAPDTEGLEFGLNIDSYVVKGIGTVTSNWIKIPKKYNGLPVTSIGDEAFRNCTLLFRSIYIPNSVTSIGDEAFYNCWLESVSIPNSVTSIGDEAFYHCWLLKSITIPNSVTSIGYGAFSGCYRLTSISIPNSVTSINGSAFAYCSALESITVASGNTKYHSAGNCIIETKSKTLIAGYKNSVIPTDGSVTKIGESAFYNCSSLKSITIPDSVTSIGDYAFWGCTALTSVTIPNSVTSIGYGAFNGCSALKSITIPDSVTEIGGSAFSNCTSLESIIIPNSVTSISDGTFRSCISLSKIAIPNSVTDIKAYAFENTAYYNNEDNWENGVLYIGKHLIKAKDTLSGDYQIKQGTITIADSAFSRCTSLTSITIPDSVTEIEEWTFYNCSSLKSITIPDSVTSIGSAAFGGCASLTSIIIPNSVTYIGSAFFGCTKLTIYCEAKSQPSGWDSWWNPSNCPVVWGYKG